MKKKFKYLIKILGVLVLTLVLINGCDLVDPTHVRNPETTEESLQKGSQGATEPFVNGVKEAFANMMEDEAYFTDCVSDNYDNTSTYISPLVDSPTEIFPNDLTLNGADEGPYFETQQLRALANFTLNTVIPNDPIATAEQRAEVMFYRAMANLVGAENFIAMPVVENGAAIAGADLLQAAISDLNGSLEISRHGDFEVRVNLALARTYRLAGNKASAVTAANAALGGPPDFVFYAEYDAANNENHAYHFSVSRNTNDMQPLPRLDFLDPKYIDRATPIPSLKMEEAHLILAEAALSDGAYSSAVSHLVDAINLAKSRPTITFVDADPRLDRPKGGTVQASPTAPAISGLIFPRNGAEVNVPTITGTSLDAAAVASLTDPVEIFRTIYLARQEMFFFEGRRMCDLGIRLPMMQRELETNHNIAAGSLGTAVLVPSYIPAGDTMDSFTITGDNTIITYV